MEPAGSEGHADSDLALPIESAGEQQARHVGASYCEKGPHGGSEQQANRTIIADQFLRKRNDFERLPRVGVAQLLVIAQKLSFANGQACLNVAE